VRVQAVRRSKRNTHVCRGKGGKENLAHKIKDNIKVDDVSYEMYLLDLWEG
jgi:hypothetical protein